MTKSITTLAILFASGTLVTQALSAATVYVGACAGMPRFATIQAAVNASAVNGTVDVCPGTYPEQVTIRRNLTLTGIQAGTSDAVVITSPAGGVAANTTFLTGGSIAAQVLVMNATSVTLNDITVDGSNNQTGCSAFLVGIYYRNASGTVSNSATRNQLTQCGEGFGILAQGGYGTGGSAIVTLQNNSVHSFDEYGIAVDGNTASGTITNNYVAGQGATADGAGVDVSDGAAGNVTNNIIVDLDIGIIAAESENVTIQNNIIGSTETGIENLADNTSITKNQVLNSQSNAILVFSNNNTISGNTLTNSAEPGIFLDGTANTVENNTINEACAGILEADTPNYIISNNVFYNDVHTVLSGSSCTASTTATTSAHSLFNKPEAGFPRPK